MIRIEDTDQARSSEESARGILEDLAWLGIEWDDGPVLRTGGGRESGVGSGERVIGANAREVGSYFQAQRVPIYDRYIRQLVERGRAYPAFETGEELEAKRKAAVAAKQTYRYDRASWKQYTTPVDRLAAMSSAEREGKPYVIRFFAPAEEIIVHDEVLGDVKYAAGEMDDFVIRKADGFPTYHFAVVVDDELMGVTHVLRAQEHLNNTPRHVALQKALVVHSEDAKAGSGRTAGAPFRTPQYAHMPLIFNMDATKMGKRDKAKVARAAVKKMLGDDKTLTVEILAQRLPSHDELSVGGWEPKHGGVRGQFAAFVAGEIDYVEVAEVVGARFGVPLPEIDVAEFRESGYLPEAITNFLSLQGWNPGLKTEDGKDLEKFDMKFLAEHFSLERIGRTNAKFDRKKLLSFNADAIAGLSDEQFAARWMEWMAQYESESHAKAARLSREQLLVLAKALKPRAKTLRDGLKPAAFALVGDDEYTFDAAAVEKNLLANDRAGRKLLVEFKPRLDAIGGSSGSVGWTPEAINAALDAFAKEKGMPNPGGIAQPLRVALTGTSVSPGLGETMAVLGKASTMKRLERCLAAHA